MNVIMTITELFVDNYNSLYLSLIIIKLFFEQKKKLTSNPRKVTK